MHYQAALHVLLAAHSVFDELSEAIGERGPIYHRGAFYSDLARAIRVLLNMGFQPLMESESSWSWWAGQCEQRAQELGDDQQYAVKLKDPAPANAPTGYSAVTGLLDGYVRFFFGATDYPGIYGQESMDSDITPFGSITPAECVKISHRLVHYKLAGRTGTYTGRPVTPWIDAVAAELKSIYRAMGEPDKAGSAWAHEPLPPGYVPPFSWPGK